MFGKNCALRRLTQLVRAKKLSRQEAEKNDQWEKRWRELGYPQQEERYYKEAAGRRVCTPTTAQVLDRWADLGVSDTGLILRFRSGRQNQHRFNSARTRFST